MIDRRRPGTGPLPMLADDALARAQSDRYASAMRYLDDLRSSDEVVSVDYLINIAADEYAMTAAEAAELKRLWLRVG